jgi:hypothetical protein
MKPPGELLNFALKDAMAGSEICKWEIVEKGPWRKYMREIIRNKEQARTTPWFNQERWFTVE